MFVLSILIDVDWLLFFNKTSPEKERRVIPEIERRGKTGKFFFDKTEKIYISDPSYGLITYTKDEFIKSWIGNNADEKTEEGIALLLETTPAFYKNEFDNE